MSIGPRRARFVLRHWSGDSYSDQPGGENAVGIGAITFRFRNVAGRRDRKAQETIRTRGTVEAMKSPKQRAEERRREKLVAIEEQIAAGSLTVRQMTAEERAQHPPRARPASGRRR